jgi:hypothetical protein
MTILFVSNLERKFVFLVNFELFGKNILKFCKIFLKKQKQILKMEYLLW